MHKEHKQSFLKLATASTQNSKFQTFYITQDFNFQTLKYIEINIKTLVTIS